MASPPNTGGGHLLSNANISNTKIKKCGYLKKQKHGHKRFFVLKEPDEGFPARLEYYESEKKWKNKSAAKRVIPLDCCLNINKRADAKHKHLIALYTKDEYFAVSAENEQEQENWYRVLTDLMSEGKVYSDGSASNSASSLVGFDEANYGMITPVTAVYKEVWQVNLKSKGLGQSRNLTGVYRLCLSSRTISFVKLNSDVASVSLQLMNIRRCGHSESFFFIEVGRSAATGPGELWMQADDSVVAQNIHETILEAMKAMKELSEFRPRSKSQSSGTNPISVPTRRHHNNLPPSQTGLQRRSRTDSMAKKSPMSKFTSCRIRTASEGDGTMSRTLPVNGSPLSPGIHRTLLGSSNTITAQHCRTFESSSLQHSKSMSMPLSHSPPTATPSPVSLSSCSESSAPRPSSCNASVSGSPSDGGFISCDEYGSSPAALYLTRRSNTPESLRADTPPSRDSSDLHGYIVMERQNQNCFRRLPELDKAYRKRTYSLTTPPQHRAPPQVSSTSLDEYTLMRATYTSSGQSGRSSHTASPKVTYPEDYGDVQIGSNGHLGDCGYMPMTPGIAPQTGWVKGDAYMPMSPMCVSAPKQIINPRSHPSPAGLCSHTDSPGSVSLEDSGYMRMFCGAKMSVDSSDGKLTNGEYLNMSPVDPVVSLTPPDYILTDTTHQLYPHHRQPYSISSLTRSLKAQPQRNGVTDTDQYVVMSLQRQRIEEESNYCPISPVSIGTPPTNTLSSAPSILRASRVTQEGGLVHRGRVSRPTRLALDSLRTLPCMSEHPLPSEPRSPGEYINIDFGNTTRYPPVSTMTESSASSLGSVDGPARSSPPLSEYVNINISSCSSKHRDSPSSIGRMEPSPVLLVCPSQPHREDQREREEGEEEEREEGKEEEREEEEERVIVEYPLQKHVSPVCPVGAVKDDYTEMTFSPTNPSASLPASLCPSDSTTPLPTSPSASLPASLCPSDSTTPLPTSPSSCIQRLTLGGEGIVVVPPVPVESFLLGGPSIPPVNPDRGAKVIRADPQGRRRHSSETFSSTTTVTPVSPSFAHDANMRHSSASVENVSRLVRSSEGSDEEYGNSNSPMCRETSAGYQNGLNYIALNLMEGSLGGCSSLGGCEGLLRFKAACGCKGGMNGFNASPYATMGFKETATAVKGEPLPIMCVPLHACHEPIHSSMA
ncbi:insulin receptor substrate 2-like [Salvelinus sp. IW2-2015]|uniref:insulin receptor substrate 2-like n=1 Tax=Salvelinus sp. IW2-2015 TaxID=2691554 RepID=UPI000CDF681C|nr:insulin receptor substrate 2-like [Salvelinus alpinus]